MMKEADKQLNTEPFTFTLVQVRYVYGESDDQKYWIEDDQRGLKLSPP